MPALNVTETYRLFAYVREFILLNGYAPSIHEIMAALDVSSTNTARHRLRKLEKSGYLRVTPKVDRGIALTAFGRTLLPWK